MLCVVFGIVIGCTTKNSEKNKEPVFTVAEGVTAVDASTFARYDTDVITSLTVGKDVKTIDFALLNTFPRLENITIHENNAHFATKEHYIVSKDGNALYLYGTKRFDAGILDFANTVCDMGARNREITVFFGGATLFFDFPHGEAFQLATCTLEKIEAYGQTVMHHAPLGGDDPLSIYAIKDSDTEDAYVMLTDYANRLGDTYILSAHGVWEQHTVTNLTVANYNDPIVNFNVDEAGICRFVCQPRKHVPTDNPVDLIKYTVSNGELFSVEGTVEIKNGKPAATKNESTKALFDGFLEDALDAALDALNEVQTTFGNPEYASLDEVLAGNAENYEAFVYDPRLALQGHAPRAYQVYTSLSDFLNEEQRSIYSMASSIISLFTGDGAWVDQLGAEEEAGTSYERQAQEPSNKEYIYNDNHYRAAVGRYKKFSDFKDMCLSVFTKELWHELNGTNKALTRFVEHEGELYYLCATAGGIWGTVGPDTYELVSKTDTELRFNVTGYYADQYVELSHIIETRTYPIVMVLTEDGWRLDNFADTYWGPHNNRGFEDLQNPANGQAFRAFALGGDVVLPEGTTSVYYNELREEVPPDTPITSITFPTGYVIDPYDIFSSTVQNYYVGEDNADYVSIDGVIYSKDKTHLVAFPTGRTGSYTLPLGVTHIDGAAFRDTALGSLYLPDTVARIEDFAFNPRGDAELRVSLPKNISLSELAFPRETFETADVASGRAEWVSVIIEYRGTYEEWQAMGLTVELPAERLICTGKASSSAYVINGFDIRTIDRYRNIAWAIRAAVGKNEGENLTREDLLRVTRLNIDDLSIGDLTPLKALANLEELYAYSNGIVDLTPLTMLDKLRVLDVSYTYLADITPVAEMPALTELRIEYTNVKDLSPLTNHKSLKALSVSYENVDALAPLTTVKNLTSLQLCGFANSEGNDKLFPFLATLKNVTVLELGGMGIDDISALAALSNLTELYLDDNAITDITPLRSLQKLERLSLTGNPLTDIRVLAELPRLKEIWLTDKGIRDDTPVQHVDKVHKSQY